MCCNVSGNALDFAASPDRKHAKAPPLCACKPMNSWARSMVSERATQAALAHQKYQAICSGTQFASVFAIGLEGHRLFRFDGGSSFEGGSSIEMTLFIESFSVSRERVTAAAGAPPKAQSPMNAQVPVPRFCVAVLNSDTCVTRASAAGATRRSARKLSDTDTETEGAAHRP